MKYTYIFLEVLLKIAKSVSSLHFLINIYKSHKNSTFKIFDTKIAVPNLHRLSGKKENEASDCFVAAALAKGVQGNSITNECHSGTATQRAQCWQITEVLLN